MQISLVIPCFNEDESLTELTEWIDRVLSKENLSYEIIFIDDGSTDKTWYKVKELKSKFPQIKGIQFNRNYGKATALNHGFEKAQGDVVITMDADLQDSPDELPALYRMIKEEGYQMVTGWKKERKDPIGKRLPSRFFNWVVSKISKIPIHDFNCGLKAYDPFVVKSIKLYGDMHRYIPAIAKWNGFTKIGEKVVKHYPRKYGYSKYGLSRIITGYLDLLSITFVSKFGKHPMHFFGTLGTLSFLIGFLASTWMIGDKLYHNIILNKATEHVITDKWYFYIALLAVTVGTQLFLTGFLGELWVMSQQKAKHDVGYLIKESID